MSSHGDQHAAPVWAQNIRRERLARGLTQRKLAELLDTDPMSVSRWERGLRPSAKYEAALVDLLFGGDLGALYQEPRVAESLGGEAA